MSPGFRFIFNLVMVVFFAVNQGTLPVVSYMRDDPWSLKVGYLVATLMNATGIGLCVLLACTSGVD